MTLKLILNWKKALRFFKLVFPLSVILENFKFLLCSPYAFYPVMLFFKFYSIICKSDQHCLLSVCTSLIKILNWISQAENYEKINQHCWHWTVVQSSTNPSGVSCTYVYHPFHWGSTIMSNTSWNPHALCLWHGPVSQSRSLLSKGKEGSFLEYFLSS